MTLESQLDCLAAIFLVCVVFVAAIDFGAQFNIKFLNQKWTMFWSTARYTGIVCGVVMALNLLTS